MHSVPHSASRVRRQLSVVPPHMWNHWSDELDPGGALLRQRYRVARVAAPQGALPCRSGTDACTSLYAITCGYAARIPSTTLRCSFSSHASCRHTASAPDPETAALRRPLARRSVVRMCG